MKSKTAARTVIGREHDHNEDAVCTGTVADKTILIVADGMDGHQAGDVASGLAVDQVVEVLTEHDCDKISPTEAPNVLLQAVNLAHETVSNRAASDPELEGMGTTVVAALVDGATVTVVNAGDSRVYYTDDDGTDQIITDHSVAQPFVEQGILTPVKNAYHPQRHVPMQAIVTDSDIDPEIVQFTLEGTTQLCSNGLTAEVAEPPLRVAITRRESVLIAVVQLIDRGNKKMIAVMYLLLLNKK